MGTAILPNLGGPDLIVILMIIAFLSAPGVIAVAIVLFLERRRNQPPPLPQETNPEKS